MNTTKIIQNSWNLMLRYRALWIFGVILALTTVSFGSLWWLTRNDEIQDQTLVDWEISAKDQAWIKENFGLDLPLSYMLQVEDLTFRLDDPLLSMQERARLLNIVLSVIAILLFLLVLILVFRYTAEAALIRMVNDQQYRKEEHTAREGWSLGFSIAALKMFLIDLVVYPLLIMLTLLLILPSLSPVLIASIGSPAAISIGVLLMLSLLLVSAAAMIVMWIAGMVTLQLARRACCLDGLGVFASIWRGFRLMRAQLRGVGLTWLVIVGLELVYPILVAPVGILLVAFGLAGGGLLAVVLGTLLAIVMTKITAWTVALIVGVVLLVLAVVVPLTLLSGLREVFISAAWTLTFKEAVGYQSVESEPVKQPALPQAGTA